MTELAAGITHRAQVLGVDVNQFTLKLYLPEEIEVDPLGCDLELDQLEQEITRQGEMLDAVERERMELCTGLSQARVRLEFLRNLIGQSHAAIQEARLKISTPAEFETPPEEDDLLSLVDWLAKLDATASEGRWSAVKVGLRRWKVTCEAKIAAVEGTRTVNRKLLDERADLRGRFQAYLAKLNALEKRGQFTSPILKRLIPQVEAALEARPFDLGTARHWMAEFDRHVIQNSAKPP